MNYWLILLACFLGGMTFKWVMDVFFLRHAYRENEQKLNQREAEFTTLKHEHSRALTDLKNRLTELEATSKAKALAEANMRVFVNGKLSAGAWMWQSNSSAVFRQKGFWQGHATITIKFTLKGVDLYESKQFRYIGRISTNRTYVLHTTRAFVAKVNAVTDRMKVFIDGHLVKNFPVSLGKKGFETRSGIKTVMEKYATRHMTSKMLGITDPADQYTVDAPWAVRLTWSGEFVHGAPWAAYRIGKWNGSHGCTNLLAADAKWFYDHSFLGDPVITTGTNRSMEANNTVGGDFNIPWSTWLAHSQLKGHWPATTLAFQTGSRDSGREQRSKEPSVRKFEANVALIIGLRHSNCALMALLV